MLRSTFDNFHELFNYMLCNESPVFSKIYIHINVDFDLTVYNVQNVLWVSCTKPLKKVYSTAGKALLL